MLPVYYDIDVGENFGIGRVLVCQESPARRMRLLSIKAEIVFMPGRSTNFVETILRWEEEAPNVITLVSMNCKKFNGLYIETLNANIAMSIKHLRKESFVDEDLVRKFSR